MRRIEQFKGLLLILLGVIPLVSCVDVEDFGDFWRTAGMDKRLIGSWKVVAATPAERRENGHGIGDVWRVDSKGSAFELWFPGAGKATDEQPLYPIKTLNVGRYQFLVFGQTKGQLIRYKLQGRTLHVCEPDLAEYVRKRYSDSTEIKNDEEASRIYRCLTTPSST